MPRTKIQSRIVYVGINEEVHVETPVGAIIVTCDTYYGHPRVDIYGDMYEDTRTIKSKQFASITLSRRSGPWVKEWEKTTGATKVARLRQARRRKLEKKEKR